MDLSKIKNIHIIGIEGSGTSALAGVLYLMGKNVRGSDEGDHFYYDVLKSRGIEVFHKFDKNHITSDLDLVIYSTAHTDNEEYQEVKSKNLRIMSYPEALAVIFNQKKGISVCGTHGKTTTSAWLAFLFEKSGLSPTAIIGSKVPQFSGGSLVGKSDYFILESDEYQNKLKHYNPKIVLLNNIEYDHPDFFPNEDTYLQAFIDFIAKIPKKGCLVANFDDPNIAKIANVNCLGKVISYGLSGEYNFSASGIETRNGKQYFRVKMDGEDLGEFSTQLLGKHNVYNALAIIATCIENDIELLDIRNYLEEFAGTARRAQVMGTFRGATIIDDYAHHPTEIKTTLEGLKAAYPDKNMICVFHPHTFSRTEALLDDFAKSFEAANSVIVLDIYSSAREKEGNITSKDLVDKIIKSNGGKGEVLNIATIEDCKDYLSDKLGRDDVLVLMGAGDVYKVGEGLLDI